MSNPKVTAFADYYELKERLVLLEAALEKCERVLREAKDLVHPRYYAREKMDEALAACRAIKEGKSECR